MNYGRTLISGSRDRSICIRYIRNNEDFDDPAALPSTCTVINTHEVSITVHSHLG